MPTYLIRVPQETKAGAAAAFEEIFNQWHETATSGRISLELHASGQSVACSFNAEPQAAEVLAGLVYARVPDADIEEIPDPLTRLTRRGDSLASCYIASARSDLYPLKTWRDFEGDSLAGLLSVLSKCQPGESAVIQIVLESVADSAWHHAGLAWRKRLDRFWHHFRVKYWFKRGLLSGIRAKVAEKAAARHFRVTIRLAAFGAGGSGAPAARLDSLLQALSSFNTLDLNQFVAYSLSENRARQLLVSRDLWGSFLLSPPELAALYHLPEAGSVPNLVRVLSKREAPPHDLPVNKNDTSISFFGQTNFRSQRVDFGIHAADRRRHFYIVGKSGTGKSKLLQLLVKNDLEANRGVGVLDPHGDLVDEIIRLIPSRREQEVILFDASDAGHPPAFNLLEEVPAAHKIQVASGFLEIFRKLFGAAWSPRLEHVLRYTTLALLDTPGSTVLSILKMLTDKHFRQGVVQGIRDEVVKSFWVSEFAAWSERYDHEAITPLVNKVGQFVSSDLIRHIVGQPRNLIDFRRAMDSRSIVLMKVPRGLLGEENSTLLGAMLVTKIYQTAMSRAELSENQRVDFSLYVDEFHNFATNTFDEILSESRKYHLNLTLAHQYLGQLEERIRKTVFGNVGSLLCFRLGAEDAALIASEFKPRFAEQDLINLGVRDFCIKMSVAGETREAFSGRTLPLEIPEQQNSNCVAYSRERYTRPRQEVQALLRQEDTAVPGTSSPGSEQSKFEEPLV